MNRGRSLWIRLERAALRASGNRVDVESSSLMGPGEKRGSLAGSMEISQEALHLDMDLEIDGLEWEEVEYLAATAGNDREAPFAVPLRGTIRARADYFSYAGFTWRPVHARLVFFEEATEIRVEEATLCGIQTPGSFHLSPMGIHMSFRAEAKAQQLSHTLGCLWEVEDLMSGDFDLEGQLASDGDEETFAESLRGNLEASAKNGRIFRFHLLSRILAVVNITEILALHDFRLIENEGNL